MIVSKTSSFNKTYVYQKFVILTSFYFITRIITNKINLKTSISRKKNTLKSASKRKHIQFQLNIVGTIFRYFQYE